MWNVSKKTTSGDISVASENLIKKVKEILHEGNVTRIIIKDEKNMVLLEIPATVGVDKKMGSCKVS